MNTTTLKQKKQKYLEQILLELTKYKGANPQLVTGFQVHIPSLSERELDHFIAKKYSELMAHVLLANQSIVWN